MAKKVILAVAGAGKTYHICHKIDPTKKNLILAYSVEPVFFVTFQSDITEFKIQKIKIITITIIDKIESIMYNTDIHKKATKY